MRSRLFVVAAAAAMVMSVTSCAATIDGHASLGLGPSSAPTSGGGLPATTAPATTAPTAPTSAGGTGTPDGPTLARRLEPLPSGARIGSSTWAHNPTPTIEQFTAEVYQPQYAAVQANILRTQGLTGIAHRVWVAANGDDCDLILLSFADASGSTSRYLTSSRARRDDPTLRSYAVPGGPQSVGTYDPKLDSDGDIRSITYARSGIYEVEEFGFSVAHLHTAELDGWLTAQLRRL